MSPSVLTTLATPRGNTYVLLFMDCFSSRADMFPVTAAEFTAEGTANVLVNQYIPFWGCPRSSAPSLHKLYVSC